MKINAAIIKRLQKICDESGLSNRQFSMSLGYAPSVIQEIYSKRIKVLSKSTILILELKYGVNPEWLETGKGPQKAESITTSDKDEIEFLEIYRALRRMKKYMLKSLAKTFYNEEKVRKKSTRPYKSRAVK